ncbi:MAG: sulfatase-like hydrolase/transferase [Planctomycetota bacterium]
MTRNLMLPALSIVALFVAAISSAGSVHAAEKPNILWLTTEDIGPELGCYDDSYAVTPNLDKLAGKGMLYRHAWSNAPVCAPARTTIITGLYPPSMGAEHMRSMVPIPASVKLYPQYLQEAGYYCTNNSKEDYNVEKPQGVWNESSNKAHYKNRKPGQPFFAVFNSTGTHESQIRRRPHEWQHDPAKAPIPAYHPDTLEARQDWAQYYDNITVMDGWIGEKLKELADAGLAEDTIVFFYGDHGSGMPRSKRWPYNSGLQVPLIVYVPPKFQQLAGKEYQAGSKSERLVSFVDLAPTVLSLAGMEPPEILQGYAFLGPHTTPRQPYIYGFRGRMDERYDMVRSVRDERYVYMRNYMPHLIYGQHVGYMFETPTTAVWRKLFDEGRLNAAQSLFWQRKSPEALYDLQNDPDEVNNLADSPEHQETLARMRRAQQALALGIRDLGFLPEPEIYRRSEGSTPYEMGHDIEKYPMERIMATAEQASMLKPEATPDLIEAMSDPDSAVRYWGALGLLMRGADAVAQGRDSLVAALEDRAPTVRIAAASALTQCGAAEDFEPALKVLVDLSAPGSHGVNVSLMALNAIDALGDKAATAKTAIANLPPAQGKRINRTETYDPRVVEHLLGTKQAPRAKGGKNKKK